MVVTFWILNSSCSKTMNSLTWMSFGLDTTPLQMMTRFKITSNRLDTLDHWTKPGLLWISKELACRGMNGARSLTYCSVPLSTWLKSLCVTLQRVVNASYLVNALRTHRCGITTSEFSSQTTLTFTLLWIWAPLLSKRKTHANCTFKCSIQTLSNLTQ
jgi:hypothetical protein